jgi:hypothetical protein
MCTNCNNTPVSPCSKCNQVDCSCQYGCYDIYDTSCIRYSGDTLNCLDVSTGKSLTDILGLINLKVCSLEQASGLVKSDPTDTCPSDLQDKLQAGVNIILTPTGSGCDKKIKIDAVLGAGTIVDEQVKASATDTTAGYLYDKVTNSDCITWVKINTGLNEKVKPVIDWNCVLLKLSSLPGYCTTVQNCQIVTQPCGQVSGISKQNGTSNSLVVAWLPGVNAINYEVRLFSDAGFTSQVGSTQTVSTNSAIFSGLLPSNSYYVTIKTNCSAGASDPFGAGPFVTDQVSTPSCPSITLNAPIINNDSITVSWSAGSGATSFNVYIDNVLDSASPQGSTSFAKSGLSNGNHTIKVEALPCGGTPQSDSRQFNVNYTPPCVAPAAPQGVSGPVSNVCPIESINLNSLITNYPSGSSVEWHTANNTNSNTLVGSPSAVSVSGTYYAFSKSDSTSCYSNTSYSVILNISSCASAFVATPNCNGMTIQSGTFTVGQVSSGTVRVPISVTGSGVLYYSIFGGGFTSSVIAYALDASTSFIDIPVSYNGTGATGSHSINLLSQTSPSGSASVICTGTIPVSCPPCVLNSSDVSISNVGSSTATVNINGLASGDTYDISVYDNSGLIQAATAQSSSTYSITGLANVSAFSVDVIKKCTCGNVSSTVTKTFNTLDALVGTVILNSVGGTSSSQGGLGLTFNLSQVLTSPLTLQVAGVSHANPASPGGSAQGYGCSLIPSVFTTSCVYPTPASITIPAGVSSYTVPGYLEFGNSAFQFACFPNSNPLQNTIYPIDLYFHPGTNVTINVTCNPNGVSDFAVGVHAV